MESRRVQAGSVGVIASVKVRHRAGRGDAGVRWSQGVRVSRVQTVAHRVR